MALSMNPYGAFRLFIASWAFALWGPLVFVCIDVAGTSASDAGPSLALYCELDDDEYLVGDPVIARAALCNEGHEEISLRGGIPSMETGSVAFQVRDGDKGQWSTFIASYRTLEPGIRNPDAIAIVRPGQRFLYYDRLMYQRPASPPRGFSAPAEMLMALREPGIVYFRAMTRLSDSQTLLSKPVRVRVNAIPDSREAALDLASKLIEKASTLVRPGIEYEDTIVCDKVQRYCGESKLAELLKYKAAWITWIGAEDLIRPREARHSLIAMRDKSSGLTRDVLTFALARGFLSRHQFSAARMEARSLPNGSVERELILLEIQDGERKAAPREP